MWQFFHDIGAGTAMRLVNGHIKITNTGITGNKTIQPYMVVVNDTDATAAATLYSTSGTETSETGVTHSVRLTTVTSSITSWELWGIP